MKGCHTISKGNYSYGQPSHFLSVRQYLFMQETDGKKLYLRFFNESRETVNAFTLTLIQLSADGKEISRTERTYRELAIRPEEEFGPVEAIELDPACADFRANVLSLQSGDYFYRVSESGVKVTYRGDREEKHIQRFERKTGGRPLAKVSKTKRVSAAVVTAICLIFAVIGIVSLYFGLSALRKPQEEAEGDAGQTTGVDYVALR